MSNHVTVLDIRSLTHARTMKGALGLLAAVVLACASAPEIYKPTEWYYAQDQIELPDATPQVERGRPNAFLDSLNHYVLSLPAKLLLLNWEIQDHKLPDRNLKILEQYLELNKLHSVKIRHNQWDPIGEWRRMWKNDQVGVGYQATLGLITWLRYTLLPDRVFGGLPIPFVGGGDHFNPFSNSVNVFSSDLGVLLHEAGHAKDYQSHEARGTSFVVLRLLPGIDLWQEATASQDALQYLYCIQEHEAELRGYRTLIPAYSTYIAGYFPGGLVVTLPIVAAGHVTGRAQAMARRRALAEEQEQEPMQTRRDFLPEFCVPVPTAPSEELGEEGSSSYFPPSKEEIR